MDSLKKLLNLLETENSRVFIVDEFGEVRFVILSAAEYSRLTTPPNMMELSERLENLSRQTEDLNRAITEAQMEDWSELAAEEGDLGADSETHENVYIEPIEGGQI